MYENIVANKPKYGYVCVDCGTEIQKVNGKCRCAECQKKYRTKYETARIRKYRRSLYATKNV